MKKLNLLSKSFIIIIFFVLIFTVVKTGLIALHVIDFNRVVLILFYKYVIL